MGAINTDNRCSLASYQNNWPPKCHSEMLQNPTHWLSCCWGFGSLRTPSCFMNAALPFRARFLPDMNVCIGYLTVTNPVLIITKRQHDPHMHLLK